MRVLKSSFWQERIYLAWQQWWKLSRLWDKLGADRLVSYDTWTQKRGETGGAIRTPEDWIGPLKSCELYLTRERGEEERLCAYVWSMCMCYVHACEVQRTILGTVLQALSIFLFWDMVSDLDSWLAGHWDSGICLSLSPQCWDYKRSPQNLAFLWVLKMELGPCAWMANTLVIEPAYSNLNFILRGAYSTKTFTFCFSPHSGSRCGEWILFCFAFSLQHHHLEYRHSCVNKGTVLYRREER